MLEAVHRDRSWNAAYACASCAAVVCASLAPLASGSAAGTLTLTMQVVIADDIRACPPGTPAEATGCFSRKGAADVRGLGRVEESWDPVVDEIPAGCGPASLRFLPSIARFTVSGKGAIDVRTVRKAMAENRLDLTPSKIVLREQDASRAEALAKTIL